MQSNTKASRRLDNCQGLNYINSLKSAHSTVQWQHYACKTNRAKVSTVQVAPHSSSGVMEKHSSHRRYPWDRCWSKWTVSELRRQGDAFRGWLWGSKWISSPAACVLKRRILFYLFIYLPNQCLIKFNIASQILKNKTIQQSRCETGLLSLIKSHS